jgi:hypothetical protein
MGTKTDQALLKGLVRCAACGYAMVVLARPKYGWEGTSYACQMSHKYGRCKAPSSIGTAKLDKWVNDQLGEKLWRGDPDVWAILSGDQRYQEAQMALEEARRQLDAYIEVADVATLGREGFQRGLTARKEAVARARRAVRDAKPPDESKMPKFEEDWTDADYREELRRFVEKVVVAKADPKKRRWQPVAERVEIRWRGASD